MRSSKSFYQLALRIMKTPLSFEEYVTMGHKDSKIHAQILPEYHRICGATPGENMLTVA